MVIKVKKVPIKAYNSIGKVEWYYMLLYCVYKIISLKLKGISKELTLQIASAHYTMEGDGGELLVI